MNHKTLSKKQRYMWLAVSLLCLFLLGTALFKSWYIAPEDHFMHAVNLLQENQEDKAIPHLILAQKSQIPTFKTLSALYLARLYHHGTKKVPVSMNKAAYYYEQAANDNNPEAMYVLALLYDAGDKVPENREKAKDYIQRAAAYLPEAKYVWAVWIEGGYFGAPDTKKAVALYEQAAEAGIQNAMKSLIAIYHSGFGGFPQNIQKENYWRQKLSQTSKKK